jgi:hypothetical protein
MKFLVVLKYFFVILVNFSFTASIGHAYFQARLPKEVFDVQEPSSRIEGEPGSMSYRVRDCRKVSVTNLRRRIVNTSIQEWAYFGFEIYDLTDTRDDNPNYKREPWRRPGVDSAEALRVADSIAGYWSSTPDSAWILERQNQSWNLRGGDSRWRNPWSAAFVSWVMCESGLGDFNRFQRSVAHYSYIDQAIMSRATANSVSAFVAFDVGEKLIEPGDLLCRGSRPEYQTLAERRSQIGVGARTHCDIVIKLDSDKKRILLIGGNVRAWVRLKILPADFSNQGFLVPVPYNGRRLFAHLKLQADEVENGVFENSPSVQNLLCGGYDFYLPGIIDENSVKCVLQVKD